MENVKHVGDVVSVAIVFTTIAGWLPSIAAIISIVYGAIAHLRNEDSAGLG